MHRPAIRTFFARTVVLLAVAVAIAFLVMGLVYYRLVSNSFLDRESIDLRNTAYDVSQTYIEFLSERNIAVAAPYFQSYLNSTARSTGSTIWVIDIAGIIRYSTGIPASVESKLIPVADGLYGLPDKYRFGPSYLGGDRRIYGDFNGLLSGTKEEWVSVALPVRSDFGGLLGEIQIHHAYTDAFDSQQFPLGTLFVAVISAFAVAVLFGWIMSRSITRPIREMTDVAWRVSIGDYSVRSPKPRRTGRKRRLSRRGGKSWTSPEDELTHLAETLDSMVEKLDRTEQDRSEFIANLSHDLRTPLTSIKGFIEALLDGTIPEERRKAYLGIVRNETLRIESLVYAMADSAAVESGRVTLHESEFDVNESIRLAIVGLQPVIDEKRITVRADLLDYDEGRLMVVADRAAIDRVIYNLLSNAVKFTSPGGNVLVTTRRIALARLAEIVVEDDGPGIPEEERPFIFDRFFKSDRSRGSGGSGLGLHICRTILAAHGQSIEVDTGRMGGAAFRFHLRLS